MIPVSLRRAAIALACLLTAVSVRQMPIAAQSPLLPAVALSNRFLQNETWPGDFDEDGRTDLVGLDPGRGTLEVQLSVSGTETVTSFEAFPIHVADLNRDGFADVIARGTGPEGSVIVLRGNGDGSFAAAATFDSGAYTFALVADFDGDGHRDLALGEEPGSLHVLRGFGDFSFAPPVTLTTGAWPHGGIVADFNADGLPDIAVASRYEWHVDLYVNGGGLLFSSSIIDTDRSASDVAARDVNGDGHVDLAVSVRGENADGPYVDGFVYVYFGGGDGTFTESGRYPTPAGTQSVVFGDFNRDGDADIATVNRSAVFYDDCTNGFKNVDSVSILPGRGDGTFGPHTSFALSSQRSMWNYWQESLLQNQVASLNTSDVNGDGHTDLIASEGIVLLNEAPRANRAPVADAGPDWQNLNEEALIRGGGSDPDGHFLTFAWTHAGGVEVADHAFTCRSFDVGRHELTLTVDDGQGAVASDTTVYTRLASNEAPVVSVTAPAAGTVVPVGEPYEIRWTSGDADGSIAQTQVAYSEDDGATWAAISACDGAAHTSCTWPGPARATEFGRVRVTVQDNVGYVSEATTGRFSVRGTGGASTLPAGWLSEDIGAVGAAGSADYSAGVFTVRGSGADVWGTADELHYLHTSVSGDFDFISRVASVQNLDRWVKAGLMVREGTGAGDRHAFAIVTPRTERGLAFQARPVADGPTLHRAGPATAPPAVIWIRRRGDFIDAFYRFRETEPWTALGTQQFGGLARTLRVGFAVSSHVDGALATARFDHVSLTPIGLGGSLEGWNHVDVGAVGAAGSTHYTRPIFSVNGSGSDVWGAADEMHFAYRLVAGDFDVSARVQRVQDLDRWVKAGLMIRETLDPGSRHAFAIATPRTERGIAFQRRVTAGGLSTHTAGPASAPPAWLKLSRRGDVVTAYYRRSMTDNWVRIGTQTYSGLPDRLLVGFAVSSHVNGTVASAQFEHLSIDPAISE